GGGWGEGGGVRVWGMGVGRGEVLDQECEGLIQLLRRPLSPAPEIAHLCSTDDGAAMRQGRLADEQNEHREHAVDVKMIVDDEIEAAVQPAAGDELEADLRGGVSFKALGRTVRNPMTQFEIDSLSKGGVDAAVAIDHARGRRSLRVTTCNVKRSLQIHTLCCLASERCSYHFLYRTSEVTHADPLPRATVALLADHLAPRRARRRVRTQDHGHSENGRHRRTGSGQPASRQEGPGACR